MLTKNSQKIHPSVNNLSETESVDSKDNGQIEVTAIKKTVLKDFCAILPPSDCNLHVINRF